MPGPSHFVYISVVFILGLVIGFLLGGKVGRKARRDGATAAAGPEETRQ